MVFSGVLPWDAPSSTTCSWAKSSMRFLHVAAVHYSGPAVGLLGALAELSSQWQEDGSQSALSGGIGALRMMCRRALEPPANHCALGSRLSRLLVRGYRDAELVSD